MCGIAGYVGFSEGRTQAEHEALLDRMCRSIVHRGPDEQGTVVRGRAALGMRRLSVIDLAGGQQPIFGCTERYAVVFNGEIYNHPKLRAELEARGHVFKTNSDTESIVHAFEEFGADCVDRLRGMFAFAVYDFSEEKLFIARDRVGEKPLFYSVTDWGEFVFGSELKVLLEHPGIRREVDSAALDAYLGFGYVPEDLCIFKGIAKLPPGCRMEVVDGRVRVERYWNFRPGRTERRSETELVEMLREKIREAVEIRLVSEVPLGAFLSGGVDSSTVVAMMSRLNASPVKTFSIGFNEDSYSELKFARMAAKTFGTDHREFIVTPDLVEIVDDLVGHFDEPFADSSALPTFMVSKLAREHVTVVLSGDGGDELFGGYTRYAVEKSRSPFGKLPRIVREKLLRPLGAALPHGAFGRNYIYNVSLDPVERYLDSVSPFGDLKKRRLYAEAYVGALNGEHGAAKRAFREIAGEAPDADPIERLMYLDSRTYLPSDILTKVDRMSMAASLEARVPLLDHELIELVETIPSEWKLRGSESKYILKKAMEGIVPTEILYRRKQGFGVPIREWINERLKDRMLGTLLEPRTMQRGYFERSYIETLIDEHARGRRDHAHALWALWMLELWHRRYIDKGK
jgi:asparagine synthase (glutamine-hydrolysing)